MVYTLPGMGADSEMYPGPWVGLNNYSFLNWPEYRGETSIGDIARRIIDENGITHSDIIAGSSLGGMVALEIGFQLELKTIILFGSAINKNEINSLLRHMIPFIDCVPVGSFQRLAGLFNSTVLRMFSNSNPDFMKAMCHAIATWNGYQGALESIVRIHGEKDMIIPCPEKCFIIKGGGHLITMTHAQECIDIFKGPVSYT